MKNPGYVLSSKKLTNKEFAQKYFRKKYPVYQFHTMNICDGMDERQQLFINNDRALYELIREIHARFAKVTKISTDIYHIKKTIKWLLIAHFWLSGYFTLKIVLRFSERKR